MTVNEVINTLAKDETNPEINKKAIVELGKAVTGDLVVDTVEQTKPNWSYDVNIFPNVANCTSAPIFCRIQQINGELHIIMMGKINNPTESDITAYSTLSIDIVLPENIANKIYDVLGKKVSEVIDSDTRISTNYASVFGDSDTWVDMSKYQSDVAMHIVNAPDKNKIRIIFGRPSAMVFKAGKDTYFESRVSLDLM